MLNRLGLRLSAVKALRAGVPGVTVLDSSHGTLDDISTDQPQPFIVVYTDDGYFHTKGRGLYDTTGDHRHRSGYQKLIIEIGVSQRMQIEPGGVFVAGAIQTDNAMEFLLDVLERQVRDALIDATSPWAQVWAGFALDIADGDSQRGDSKRDGARLAGRQISLSVTLAKDPPSGDPVGPMWQRFFDLAAADPDQNFAALVPKLQALIAGKPGRTAWQITQQAFGLSASEANALIQTPPAGVEAGTNLQAPDAGTITVTVGP